MATPIDKYRITFALPWEDQLLLGTTDEAYEGDPADVRATEADIQQILDEAAFSVRDEHSRPRPDDVRLRGPAGAARRPRRRRAGQARDGRHRGRAAACCRSRAASGRRTGTSAAR